MKRALLMDRDAHGGGEICAQLSRLGFVADEVPNSGSALERCEQRPYDLLIVDLNSSPEDGDNLYFLQVVHLLWPEMPVIVLSSSSPLEKVAAAFRYGVRDWLEKPVDGEVLRERVGRWIQ